MAPHTISPGGKSTRFYYYYRCAKHTRDCYDGCSSYRHYRAEQLEEQVWAEIRGLLGDPERLRAGMDAAIEMQRSALRGDPDREARAWLDKLAEVDRKRARYQEMAAEELITLDGLRGKLADLGDVRATAERELEEGQGRAGRIAELERDRDALLESYEALALEELDDLTPEERHGFYRTLRVVVYVYPDGGVEVRGEFMPFGPPGPDGPPDSPSGSDGAGPDRNVGATRRGFSTNKDTQGCAGAARARRAYAGRPGPAARAARTPSRRPALCQGPPQARRPVCGGGTSRTCRRSTGRGP